MISSRSEKILRNPRTNSSESNPKSFFISFRIDRYIEFIFIEKNPLKGFVKKILSDSSFN